MLEYESVKLLLGSCSRTEKSLTSIVGWAPDLLSKEPLVTLSSAVGNSDSDFYNAPCV